jgi:molecular chaperone IbpA
MTILPTLALRSFVGFDNLFNELETISTQKQNSFPAHDILRISEDEYEITLALSGFNKDDISIDVHDGVLTIKGNGGTEVQNDKLQYLYKGIAKRSFEQKFRLEQYVDVKDAKLSNGLLTISLLREIPEESLDRLLLNQFSFIWVRTLIVLTILLELLWNFY